MPNAFDAACEVRDRAESDYKAASERLRDIGGGRTALGLTPDHVKALPEWRGQRAEMQAAFARLQAANAHLVRYFARELRTARETRR